MKMETIYNSLKLAIPVISAYNKNKLFEYKILVLLLILGTITVGILKLNIITNLLSGSLLELLKIYSLIYLILTYLVFIFNLKNHISLLTTNFIANNYTIYLLSLIYLISKIIFLYYLCHFYFILFNLNLISQLPFFFTFLMIFSFSSSYLLSFEVNTNITNNVNKISKLSLCLLILTILIKPLILICNLFSFFSLSSLLPIIYCDSSDSLVIPANLKNLNSDSLTKLESLHLNIMKEKGDINKVSEFNKDQINNTGEFLDKILGDSTKAEITQIFESKNKNALKYTFFSKVWGVGLRGLCLSEALLQINKCFTNYNDNLNQEQLKDFLFNPDAVYDIESPHYFLSLAYHRNKGKDSYLDYADKVLNNEKNFNFDRHLKNVGLWRAGSDKIVAVSDLDRKLLS